jgi:hypothetical protein
VHRGARPARGEVDLARIGFHTALAHRPAGALPAARWTRPRAQARFRIDTDPGHCWRALAHALDPSACPARTRSCCRPDSISAGRARPRSGCRRSVDRDLQRRNMPVRDVARLARAGELRAQIYLAGGDFSTRNGGWPKNPRVLAGLLRRAQRRSSRKTDAALPMAS